MIPSLHRYLGAKLIKVSMVTPVAAKPAIGLKPAVPAKLESIKHTQLAMPPMTNEGANTNLSAKLSSIGESLLRAVPLVAEDGVSLLARNVLKGGSTAAKFPAGYEKARAELQPDYVPNPTFGNVSKVLGALSKIGYVSQSSDGLNQPFDNGAASNPYAPYTPSKPWNDVNTQLQIRSAIDSNFGPTFPNARANEGDVQVGTNPKIAGDGSAQGVEYRGPTNDFAAQMTNHNRDSMATGAMTVGDTVNNTWDRLRAFLRDDTANMNMPGEAEAGNNA